MDEAEGGATTRPLPFPAGLLRNRVSQMIRGDVLEANGVLEAGSR
jgi:hypothetical protein